MGIAHDQAINVPKVSLPEIMVPDAGGCYSFSRESSLQRCLHPRMRRLCGHSSWLERNVLLLSF